MDIHKIVALGDMSARVEYLDEYRGTAGIMLWELSEEHKLVLVFMEKKCLSGKRGKRDVVISQ